MNATQNQGVLEIESGRVPWIDLRAADPSDPLSDLIHRHLLDAAHQGSGLPETRLIVLARPQASDDLAIALARERILLIVASIEVPASELLGLFKQHLSVTAQTPSLQSRSDVPKLPEQPSHSESVFSQCPPGFDQQVFEERMRLLQQPWQDEDRSKLDY